MKWKKIVASCVTNYQQLITQLFSFWSRSARKTISQSSVQTEKEKGNASNNREKYETKKNKRSFSFKKEKIIWKQQLVPITKLIKLIMVQLKLTNNFFINADKKGKKSQIVKPLN